MKDNPDIRQTVDTELRKLLGLIKPEPAEAAAEAPTPSPQPKSAATRR
jgi:hypothetical protein